MEGTSWCSDAEVVRARKYGAELEAITTDLVKHRQALGIIVTLATQRPDAKPLPTRISSNAAGRFCL